jgi:hypothetical protein
MSSSLAWRPRIVPQSHYLPSALKFALREEYGDPVKKIFTSNDIAFLRGLAVGKIDGAESLIELIEKHDEVEVFEEY